MATNGRTRRVAQSKSKSNDKPVYTFQEHDLEEERQGLEESAVQHIVRVYRRWRERNAEYKVSVNKFAELWQKAYPMRSAGGIRKDIQKMKKVHEFYKFIDLDTIEDTTHFDQLYDDAVSGSGSGKGKGKETKTEYARVAERAMELSPAEKRRLIAKLEASL